MKPKKKYSQVARVQAILRTLWSRNGITIGELAEEFGVTKRTLYRDLHALEDSGYPLLSEVIEGTTYWKLEPSFKHTAPITFNLNELMALYSSRKLFISQGSPQKSDLESAFKKIESALPAKSIAKVDRIEGMFHPLAKMSKKVNMGKDIFEELQLALLYQNPARLEYKPRRENRSLTYEVHPYSLIQYRGEFYLLCFVPASKGMRYFALEGIKRAERSKERFEIPEGLSISDFLNVPFGIFQGKPIKVKILFNKDLSDYIKGRTWHPTQKIEASKDGKIILSMTASGKEEIKAWILGFGPKVKVISPKTLRDEIEVDLSRSLAQYKI